MASVEVIEQFKYRFEKALALRNLKPADLSKMTGISESTISQYRSGYAKPKEQRLMMIAVALDVDPSWLLGLDVPMESVRARYSAKVAEKLVEAKNNPLFLRLFDNFTRLSPAQQDSVVHLVESMIPDKRP